jgi:hypothetical protein
VGRRRRRHGRLLPALRRADQSKLTALRAVSSTCRVKTSGRA